MHWNQPVFAPVCPTTASWNCCCQLATGASCWCWSVLREQALLSSLQSSRLISAEKRERKVNTQIQNKPKKLFGFCTNVKNCQTSLCVRRVCKINIYVSVFICEVTAETVVRLLTYYFKMPSFRSVVDSWGCFFLKLLSVRSTIWSLDRPVLSISPAALSSKQPCNKAYIGPAIATPTGVQPTNQKERHAICALSCLVTCQQRKKTNRRRRRSWGGMNGRHWRYGNVQGLVRTSKDHIKFLPNPSWARTKVVVSFLPCMSLQTRGSTEAPTLQLAALRRTWRHLFSSTITSEFFILPQSCENTVYRARGRAQVRHSYSDGLHPKAVDIEKLE